MFSNKVVLITGASSGIGAEAAVHFAKLGANLSLTGIESLDEVAKKCADISPQNLTPITLVADLTIDENVKKFVDLSLEKYQKIDILVNNAGILESGSIETTSMSQFDRVMSVNIRIAYHLTMLAVPHLIKSKGNIVNVSSVCATASFPNILSYSVSKSAVNQFTKCVALELGSKGVRVNSVNPGVILTGIHLKGAMTDEEYEIYVKKCEETHALRRTGTTAEIADSIIFLASDSATFITGVNLSCDGGKHIMCPR